MLDTLLRVFDNYFTAPMSRHTPADDLERGLDVDMPVHYFPEGDPRNASRLKRRGHASLLLCNWQKCFVYQKTPYEPNRLASGREGDRR